MLFLSRDLIFNSSSTTAKWCFSVKTPRGTENWLKMLQRSKTYFGSCISVQIFSNKPLNHWIKASICLLCTISSSEHLTVPCCRGNIKCISWMHGGAHSVIISTINICPRTFPINTFTWKWILCFFLRNYFLSNISFQWSVLWFLVYSLDNIFCMIMIPSIHIKQIIYKNIKYIKETDPTPHWPRSGIMGRERKGSLFWDKDTADFAKKYSRSASNYSEYTNTNTQIHIHKYKYTNTNTQIQI